MNILLVLLAALQTAPGTVRGRVVDARTGAPLERVLVAVEETGVFANTDADGRFELPVAAARVRLFVSLVGYVLVRRDVELAEKSQLTIPLVEGTGTYTETVTVTGDRFAVAEPAVPAQHLIGSAELQNLRGVLADDPMRAIQVLPGVVAGDDLRSEFSVRASPFSRINMTVDGFATPYILHTVRAVEDYSASGSVAMINSDILQEVALLSGGYPQRSGNRTGSEVTFRLREGSRDRTLARMAVSGTNASAVMEGPLGAGRSGSWLISARQSYLDLIVRQVAEGVQFGFTDAQTKLVFNLTPVQRVDLTLIAGRSRLEDRSSDLEGDNRFVGRNATLVAIPGWRRATPRTLISGRILAALNEFSNTATDGVRVDDGGDRQAAARLDASVTVMPGLHIEGGAVYEWARQHRARQRFFTGRYRPINDFTADATLGGAYAQVRLEAGRLLLTPGIRADHWTLTGTTTASPWLQAQLALPMALTVRGGSGVYQQFPSFEQVTGALAAPERRPERAEHYDLALEHRIGETLRWQLAVYDREESSFYRRPGAEPRLQNGRVIAGSRTAPFAQTLDGYARGIELLVQRKSASGLSGWISYAYGRNRYTDRASGESFDGDLDQRHTLNLYGFYRWSDRVSFSAKARVGSNVPAPGYYRELDGLVTLSSVRNELRMPVYSRVDLRANRTFHWSSRRLTLFAEIINVLNRDNVRFDPPGINARTFEKRRIFEQMVPILPSAGVLIEF